MTDFDEELPPLLFPMPFDPMRPTNWRWQLAESLVIRRPGRKPRWVRELSDRHVLLAKAFLEGAEQKSREADAIDQAYHLYQAAGLRRWRLEARVLAGMRVDEIAAAERLPSLVVEIYTALFYDIVDCLDASDYILSHAIQNQPRSLIPSGRGEMLKRLGYFCGPLCLSALLAEIGWNTLQDKALLGQDWTLGTYMRLLLEIDEVPPSELLKLATLLHDESLIWDPIPAIPAWISGGFDRLAREKSSLTQTNDVQDGVTDATPTVSAQEQQAVA